MKKQLLLLVLLTTGAQPLTANFFSNIKNRFTSSSLRTKIFGTVGVLTAAFLFKYLYKKIRKLNNPDAGYEQHYTFLPGSLPGVSQKNIDQTRRALQNFINKKITTEQFIQSLPFFTYEGRTITSIHSTGFLFNHYNYINQSSQIFSKNLLSDAGRRNPTPDPIYTCIHNLEKHLKDSDTPVSEKKIHNLIQTINYIKKIEPRVLSIERIKKFNQLSLLENMTTQELKKIPNHLLKKLYLSMANQDYEPHRNIILNHWPKHKFAAK